MNYNDFLKKKQKKVVRSGFEIDEDKLNDMLFNFQKFTVKRALKAGKYAIFYIPCYKPYLFDYQLKVK